MKRRRGRRRRFHDPLFARIESLNRFPHTLGRNGWTTHGYWVADMPSPQSPSGADPGNGMPGGTNPCGPGPGNVRDTDRRQVCEGAIAHLPSDQNFTFTLT